MITIEQLAVALLFSFGVLAFVIFAALVSHRHIKRTRELKEGALQIEEERAKEKQLDKDT